MARSSTRRYSWAYVWVGGRLIALRPLTVLDAQTFRNHYAVRFSGAEFPSDPIGTIERTWDTPRVWTAVLGDVRRDFKTRQDAVGFIVRESGQ